MVAVRGLDCSMACGILPHQGLNPCLLRWQAYLLPPRHQGSSGYSFYFILFFYFFLGIHFKHSSVHMLEKAMAPHSSTLAWQIPWMEEPGRLQSMGSLGVRHDSATSLSLFTFMHWRRKWQPTPVFLPGESKGWDSVVGCHL